MIFRVREVRSLQKRHHFWPINPSPVGLGVPPLGLDDLRQPPRHGLHTGAELLQGELAPDVLVLLQASILGVVPARGILAVEVFAHSDEVFHWVERGRIAGMGDDLNSSSRRISTPASWPLKLSTTRRLNFPACHAGSRWSLTMSTNLSEVIVSLAPVMMSLPVFFDTMGSIGGWIHEVFQFVVQCASCRQPCWIRKTFRSNAERCCGHSRGTTRCGAH